MLCTETISGMKHRCFPRGKRGDESCIAGAAANCASCHPVHLLRDLYVHKFLLTEHSNLIYLGLFFTNNFAWLNHIYIYAFSEVCILGDIGLQQPADMARLDSPQGKV